MAEETKKPESVILEWTADRLHYIADKVFAIVPVQHQADKYFV